MLSTYSDLDLTSGCISTVNRNQQNYPTMDLPVELVGLLKHAEIDGKKLTWDIQVNFSPEKETPLSFHQEKKCSTHQPVEGEKE